MSSPDLFNLDGQVALITGGGRGLGRFIAEGLAGAGAEVIVASRKIDNCRAAAQAIRDAGGQASAMQADVSKPEDVERLVDEIIADKGRIDILVNNAALGWAAAFLDYPLEGWDRVFALNIRAVFLLSQRVARHMKEQGRGSIIQISSLSARFGASEEEQPVTAYMASKGAVEALTRDMAVKLAPHGIRVNSIAPGPFDTDMLRHIKEDEEMSARHDRQVPMGRPGRAADIQGVAVFLASEAASYITGTTLTVDGGISAVYPVRKFSVEG